MIQKLVAKPTSKWLLIVLIGLTLVRPLAAQSLFEKQLAEAGISTDEDSLVAFVQAMTLSRSNSSGLGQLVQDLGSDTYRERVEATKQLIKSPFPIDFRLRTLATQTTDEEMKQRIKLILRKRKSTDRLVSLLMVIGAKKTNRVHRQLFQIIPACQTRFEKELLITAIVQSAQMKDREWLLKRLDQPPLIARIAAAKALYRIANSDSEKQSLSANLAKRLDDSNERVKVTFAQLLLPHKSQLSISTLVSLLSAKEVDVRVTAAATLRQASGKSFGYIGYMAPATQHIAIDSWKEWLDAKKEFADLNLELDRTMDTLGFLDGHTLLAYGNTNNKVALLDAKLKETWSYPARTPRAAEKLRNGNFLISELQNNRVIEINPRGKIIWQVKVKSPLTVYPLSNGNLLVAQFDSPSQALEINRAKEIVWRMPIKGNCCAAFPMKNGNTLIAAYGNSVFEVDRFGQVVWDYPETQSHGCRQLENGNILIANQPGGRVQEVNRKKEVVWQCRHHGAVDAFRLKNGNTLVSGNNQTIEITADQKIVWAIGNCQYGTARQ